MGWVRRVPFTRPHRCLLPDPLETDPGSPYGLYRRAFGDGTMFRCDGCGKLWRITWGDWVPAWPWQRWRHRKAGRRPERDHTRYGQRDVGTQGNPPPAGSDPAPPRVKGAQP